MGEETIQFFLNGEAAEAESGICVTDLLLREKIRPELVTVEVNGHILQKLDYDSTDLRSGDRVEVIFYMGGD